MLQNHLYIALFLAIASFVGCAGSDQEKAYPTSGVVHFNGKPMKGGGAISFVPVSSQQGKAAGGEIRDDGTFVMTTYEDGDGSIPGEFRVLVMQSTSKEPEMVASDEGSEPVMSSGPIDTVAKGERIPFIYADPAKSPITVEVKAQDKNELTIDLKR
ncbi:hypothetical protein C5Y97_01295 [Blastopirellula marina]|uniref:Carboxypeptidase regulatory-like domain-containing protein n=2 Tax=Blastopirellula marina TaxID=124 RepID=A0A2S8GED2_9BACT|nr:hypothetical protein C5Y98_01295 [Blastopirellula marina]PTL46583.1 hypothetical protein C5Y97_01295 [Blastopirellula marina]